MSEHTPGPWTPTNGRRGVFEIIANGEMLAQVWRVGAADDELPAAANARLIAKAPELLNALKAAHNIARSVEDDIRKSPHCETQKIALNSIGQLVFTASSVLADLK